MTSFLIKPLLHTRWQPSIQFVRFRNRINIQRPAAPHYERAKVISLCRPIFPDPLKRKPLQELCQLQSDLMKNEIAVDNPYERLIARELMNWLTHSKMVVFFHLNPMGPEDRLKTKIMLGKQNMTIKVYGHKTVRIAVENTFYEPIMPLFQSHNCVVFSAEPQAAKLLKLMKKVPKMVLMASIVEGRLLSKNEFVRYSQLPDLKMAQAGLVSVLNSSANQMRQLLTQHQQTLVSHLQQHINLQQKPQTEPE